mgnify:CR=1 FL=1
MLAPAPGMAESWPDKPVNYIIPFGDGGESSIAVDALNVSASSAKYRRSSSTDSASRQEASSMKSERFLPSASAARSIRDLCFWLARRLMFTSRVARFGVVVFGM